MPSAFAGLDWPQLTVAAVATGGYAATSIVLRRAVYRRRRRDAWRDARFVSLLIEQAGDGRLQTLSDVVALYRGAGGPSDGNHHRLERLIDRATARLHRRSERSRVRRHGEVDSRGQQARHRLEQLSAGCRAAWMDDVIRNARVAADDVDWVRLDAQQHVSRGAAAGQESAGERRKRRVRERRTASMLRRGIMGAGCVIFVQIALVVWHSLR